MSKKLLLLTSMLLFIIVSLSGCERDDLCAEDTLTTPKLIIRFFDIVTGSELKQPNELLIRPIGVMDSIFFPTNVDSIAIPLQTDSSITTFEFSINADTTNDETIQNRDTISFQYTVEQEYISSACGFRATFNGLDFTGPQQEVSENWIKQIDIQNRNITDEQETHVFIFL